MSDVLNPNSAEKVQLGMGELFNILTTGTNTATESETWAFLEIAPDTEITSLTFEYLDGGTEIVTRYNLPAYLTTTLIPPVFKQKRGSWISVTCEGQVNCYGLNPIG